MIPLRAYIAAGAAALALLACTYVIHLIRKDAAHDAVQTIEGANDAARTKADDASNAVDACYARGGRWNRVTRMCVDGLGQ